jgi:calcium-dependent protein kinase
LFFFLPKSDLKPENLLYESNKEGALLKVIDFGTSRIFDVTQKMNQKFGTVMIEFYLIFTHIFKPYYIAPEVLKKKYDEKCDIWSCGVILYILLCGFPPFNGENDKEIMERVAKGSYSFDFDEWKQISGEAKQFIKKMLEYDPVKRYNAEQAINDPWIKKYSGKNIVDIPLMENALRNMTNFRVSDF